MKLKPSSQEKNDEHLKEHGSLGEALNSPVRITYMDLKFTNVQSENPYNDIKRIKDVFLQRSVRLIHV